MFTGNHFRWFWHFYLLHSDIRWWPYVLNNSDIGWWRNWWKHAKLVLQNETIWISCFIQLYWSCKKGWILVSEEVDLKEETPGWWWLNTTISLSINSGWFYYSVISFNEIFSRWNWPEREDGKDTGFVWKAQRYFSTLVILEKVDQWRLRQNI